MLGTCNMLYFKHFNIKKYSKEDFNSSCLFQKVSFKVHNFELDWRRGARLA